jgi:radical SAM protein with 4Fe4S-binding SPASM domain
MRLSRNPFYWLRMMSLLFLARISSRIKVKNLLFPVPNILIFVTSICNKTCAFCHYYDGLNLKNAKEEDMSIGQLEDILSKREVSSVGRICFYGGEPLLNEDIFKMIEYSKSKNYITSIFTNGILFKNKMNELKKSSLDFISLSYYPEDIEKIKEFVKELSAYVPINVSFMISQGRLDLLPRVFEDCHEMGVAMLTVENYTENGQGSQEEVFENSAKLKKYKNELKKRYGSFFLIRWSQFSKVDPKNLTIGCSNPWDTLIVNSKGEQLPCCHFPLKEFTGNIYKDTDFKNNEKSQELRTSLKNNKPGKYCKNCHCLYRSKLSYFKIM